MFKHGVNVYDKIISLEITIIFHYNITTFITIHMAICLRSSSSSLSHHITIRLTSAPTQQSENISLLGHYFIFTYSCPIVVFLNPSFHASLPTSRILSQITSSILPPPHTSLGSPFHSHSHLK